MGYFSLYVSLGCALWLLHITGQLPPSQWRSNDCGCVLQMRILLCLSRPIFQYNKNIFVECTSNSKDVLYTLCNHTSLYWLECIMRNIDDLHFIVRRHKTYIHSVKDLVWYDCDHRETEIFFCFIISLVVWLAWRWTSVLFVW